MLEAVSVLEEDAAPLLLAIAEPAVDEDIGDLAAAYSYPGLLRL